jgi:SAM-dependent methyltransferase
LRTSTGHPSLRHSGQEGHDYANHQAEQAEQAAVLNAWKFRDATQPDDTLIDFGCGPGALLDLLPGRCKIGVEVNAQARARAQQRGHDTYPSSTELPSETADVVISNHALEHTLSPHAELLELHRALKPGGRLYLWLPIDDWRAQRSRSRGLDKDHHLYTWTPRLIANLLVETGFHVETTEVVTDAWPPRHAYELQRRLPRPAFQALRYLTATLLRRRQLRVVASKSGSSAERLPHFSSATPT